MKLLHILECVIPHLLSTCENPYLKGLRIAQHNKAAHLITQTLQANKNIRLFTMTLSKTILMEPGGRC